MEPHESMERQQEAHADKMLLGAFWEGREQEVFGGRYVLSQADRAPARFSRRPLSEIPLASVNPSDIRPSWADPGRTSHRYPMAPLIRFTLISLYGALVLPLPVLAPPGLKASLVLAALLGLGLVLAATSEQVVLDGEGIRVGHPAWCRWLLRRGWSLTWCRITGLTPVTTSQGGRVFYVRSSGEAESGIGPSAYLLPQRVVAFDDFLTRFSRASGLDTSSVGRISPAWTYQLLAVLATAMLAVEMIALMVLPLPVQPLG